MSSDRSHPQCWTGHGYRHTCQRPSGQTCVEAGCDQPAGTRWGPYWCPDCDVERLDRIMASLEAIAGQLEVPDVE
jgi:hypothetical protein